MCFKESIKDPHHHLIKTLHDMGHLAGHDELRDESGLSHTQYLIAHTTLISLGYIYHPDHEEGGNFVSINYDRALKDGALHTHLSRKNLKVP